MKNPELFRRCENDRSLHFVRDDVLKNIRPDLSVCIIIYFLILYAAIFVEQTVSLSKPLFAPV